VRMSVANTKVTSAGGRCHGRRQSFCLALFLSAVSLASLMCSFQKLKCAMFSCFRMPGLKILKRCVDSLW
jgi:hypothetical protein